MDCKYCRGFFEIASQPSKVFCTDRCCRKWWRRQSEKKKLLNRTFSCPCGRCFASDRKRKWCSIECRLNHERKAYTKPYKSQKGKAAEKWKNVDQVCPCGQVFRAARKRVRCSESCYPRNNNPTTWTAFASRAATTNRNNYSTTPWNRWAKTKAASLKKRMINKSQLCKPNRSRKLLSWAQWAQYERELTAAVVSKQSRTRWQKWAHNKKSNITRRVHASNSVGD